MSKFNMQVEKTSMPEQDPQIRNKNFKEVSYGYTPEMAINEAKRCIKCKHKPCMAGCPVEVKIPEFIDLIAQGEFLNAYYKLKETNGLPAVCGRVCPQETQCEQLCVRGIKHEPVAIGRLERFAADYGMEHDEKKPETVKENGKKVAVVGSGPAGLTCASDLVKLGYKVTIFEALHLPGGVLQYGIPEFRLPKQLVYDEIEILKDQGVEILYDMVIGKILTVDELMNEMGFDAIFIGSGAGLPAFMNIPGENLKGVYSANEFLSRINLMRAYDTDKYDTPIFVGKKAVIVGGGNVAMDAARSAKRLGAEEVHIIYRRSEEEMPARLEEIHHAKEEGIIFDVLMNPTEIIADENGWVESLKCIKMELGEPDESGRRRPVPIEGSEIIFEANSVVISIGNTPNPLIKNTTEGLETNKWGCILAEDETGKTAVEGVYAGGDTVTGAATVILAMGAGKSSAIAIDEFIKNK